MQTNKNNINSIFITFLGKLIFLTLFLLLMVVALVNLFPSMIVPSKMISIFIVVFAVTAGVHYVLLRASRGEGLQFANFIILSVVIKLILYAIFTFLLIVSDRQGAMPNVILFFSLYIVFTVFEITNMYHQVKR